jgi:hypothetical protein
LRPHGEPKVRYKSFEGGRYRKQVLLTDRRSGQKTP